MFYRRRIAKSALAFALMHSLPVHAFCNAGSTNSMMTSGSSGTAVCGSASSSAPQKELYEKLKGKLAEIEKLNGVKGLLGWDEMVMLAPGSAEARNDQKSALSGVIFEKSTDSSLQALLEEMKKTDLRELPSDYDRAVVRDAERDFLMTARKSKEMTMKESELEGRGYQSWVAARQASDFSLFSPVLQEIVTLKAEIAAATHPHLPSAYDANVDLFERGMKVERLEEIFTVVKAELW